MTNQFIGLTPLESEFLIKKLKKLKKEEQHPCGFHISFLGQFLLLIKILMDQCFLSKN